MRIAIIGLGLMGGSMALALRRSGFGQYFYGIDSSPSHQKIAIDRLIVDEIGTVEQLPPVDLIILATPINSIEKLLIQLLDQLTDNTIIMDVGSTKKNICSAVKNHPNRRQYVATHPMSGTENNGPEAAFAELFLNKVSVICDAQDSDTKAVECIKKLYSSLWMRVIEMDSEAHDRHIAYVSHLSHITSFALGNTVLKIEKDEKNIFDMASTGFASTVRLAKSSPDMWAPIFDKNKDNILFALEAYIDNLNQFKTLLENNDNQAIKQYMTDTNDIRRVLEGIQK